ncbi:hypothetical protein BGX29_000425, partial [Mortierella sp. GBA35]
QVLEREVAPVDQAPAAEDIVEVESESVQEDIVLATGSADQDLRSGRRTSMR